VIRIGLVGCGHIGTVHAVALHQLAGAGLVDARLTTTFDDDAARASRVARHHGGEPAASLDALLDDVDVVWVCTWTAGHLAVVEAAADRGVAIFCEKPLATDLAGATQVAAALQRVPHQVGLVLRWSCVFRELERQLASGVHGRVLTTVMRDDQYFPVQGMYRSTWRGDVAYAGGGTLIEHSIHDLDLLRFLLGDPREVSGRTASRFGYPGIEDTAVATLVYGDGSVAQLTSVWHQVLSRESSRRLEVFCEKAMLWTDDDNLGPLHVETDDGEQIVELDAPPWSARFDLPEIYRKPLAPYAQAAKAFLDGLACPGSPDTAGRATAGYPSASDALAAHRIVELVYQSAADGGLPRSAVTERAGEAG
jgi:predicted dehydrogenase